MEVFPNRHEYVINNRSKYKKDETGNGINK
jgi:hypothetical protein